MADKELLFPIEEHELRKGAVYQPVFVRCTCINREQCVPNRNPLETNASVCMCFEDITRGLIWPCYPTNAWTVKVAGPLLRYLETSPEVFPLLDPVKHLPRSGPAKCHQALRRGVGLHV